MSNPILEIKSVIIGEFKEFVERFPSAMDHLELSHLLDCVEKYNEFVGWYEWERKNRLTLHRRTVYSESDVEGKLVLPTNPYVFLKMTRKDEFKNFYYKAFAEIGYGEKTLHGTMSRDKRGKLSIMATNPERGTYDLFGSDEGPFGPHAEKEAVRKD